MPDGNDHIIYVVDRNFQDYAEIAQRPLIAGEWVHFWGNPLKDNDISRSGWFKESKMVDDIENIQVFVLPVYPGDSGSGIFDESGKIVAVVTMNNGVEEGSLSLQFTPLQLSAIR